MTPLPVLRRSRLGARIVPLIVAMGALPLMAPTCGSPGEGFKTFSRQSLIIPMDVCYQSQADAAGTPTAVGCPQASDPGSVIKAYGLVYQLIRAGVPVYWIIRQDKASLTDVDLTVQYASGAPVLLYDWAAGNPAGGAAPTASHSIDYRGGPFVVDGSDYVKASAVLQQFKGSGGTTLAPAPFQTVNVHVANVSFRGYAKRTMAGGWSAGGATPPKLALLDIGSSGAGAKNSEFVIQGYLAQAGLDTPNAGGTSAPGAHGQIYDRLFMPDFIPTVPGADWTRTRLYANAYQILWIPHWAAPSSCATCAAGASCNQAACDGSRYDPVTISSALKTIGQFVAGGKDLFAECAGMGSLEGVVTGTPPNPTGTNATYGTAVAETHLQTGPSPSGVFIETNTPGAAVFRGPFTSPLLQIGDFRFTPASGAISDWKATRYTPAVDPGGADSTVRMIQETPGGDTAWDLFTIRPGFGAKGTVVYLGGHSYSGNDGSFSTSGTRLVLNTLFNLGAGCVASGLACNTGLFGVCSQGVWACDSNGQPFCQQTVFPRAEACNGLDDDCNGAVDEGLVVNCYAAPAGYADPLGRTGDPFLATSTVGSCHSGVSSCGRNPDGTFGMSACVGQVLPAAETCNGLDDDCNGAVDDALTRSCYDGPTYTLDFSVDPNGIPKGICAKGTQVCQSGAWGGPLGAGFVPGVCPGEQLPEPEFCPADASTVTTALDLNCDGTIISCTCTNGQTRPCFSGPGTPGVGACRAGTQSCTGGTWGECNGEVVAILFQPEACTTPAKPSPDPGYKSAADTNCDGRTTQCAECTGTEVQSCYGPDPGVIPTIAGRGPQCTWGTRTCDNGAFGPCVGYGLPSAIEYCDGKDNNCNGPRVASPHPGPGGAVIPAAGALTGAGTPAGTDDNATCPAGSKCLNGVCVASTCGVEVPPPEGYVCSSGQVQQGTCGASSCGLGELCRYGTCDNPCPVGFDPTSGTTVSLVCASGTVGSSRVDLQACKLEYSIVSPK